MLGVSPGQVCYDLKKVRLREIKGRWGSNATAKNSLVESYFDIIRENWEAWERSKQDAHEQVVEETAEEECRVCKGSGKGKMKVGKTLPDCARCGGSGTYQRPSKVTTTTTGRLPASAYMGNIMAALEAIRDMIGLDAPKENKIRAEVLNWDVAALARALPPDGEVIDTIEAEIQAVLAGTETPDKPSSQQLLQELPPPSGNGESGKPPI
jgi:hypothetical protein